ncbi:MAG TPA: ATP-dependent helicase [Kofleriaceae bacterium]|jgi:superfamily I DNA/RNA helicase
MTASRAVSQARANTQLAAGPLRPGAGPTDRNPHHVDAALEATRAASPHLHAALLALDPDQRAAVLSGDRATLVHAQVGSGKTTVLVHRVAYLHVACGVPLEQIAVLTFTNRAAAEIRSRLDAVLGRATSERERWLVGTFHSAASALLRCSLPVERVGHTRHFTILDDDAALDLAVAVARKQKLRPGRRASLRDRMRTDRSLASIATAFAAERRARDAMDFDDLLEHATVLLGDRTAGLAHVLVDELQDCEPRDLAFVRALVGASAQFFAVGDPLQSIYGWRGASPELFASMACRVRTLPQSYRSTQTLLVGARAILGAQPAPIGELVPVRGPGATISIVRHHDITAEAAYLAARLSQLHADGLPWNEVAVLCRLRTQVADLAAALATRGVPCVSDLDEKVEQAPNAAPGVRILTIHAAKGLEFTHVFLSGANVGVLPLLSRDPDGDGARHADPAEERRLLFVAITRARDAVEVSYQSRPHTHGAFGVASPLLLLLPAHVVARDDSPSVSPVSLAVAPPPQPAPAIAKDWHVGQRVRHPRYGRGTIVTLAGDTIDCDFGKLGPRAFPRVMCPLTVEP